MITHFEKWAEKVIKQTDDIGPLMPHTLGLFSPGIVGRLTAIMSTRNPCKYMINNDLQNRLKMGYFYHVISWVPSHLPPLLSLFLASYIPNVAFFRYNHPILWIARKILKENFDDWQKRGDANVPPPLTWAGYCVDIGIDKTMPIFG